MNDGSPKLLVVGDDDHFRSSLRAQLEKAGYHVLEASDATDTLNVLNDHRVALIVAELNEKLLIVIRQALVLHDLQEENRLLREQRSEQYHPGWQADHRGGTPSRSVINRAAQLPDHNERMPVDPSWLADRLLDTGISLAEVERQLIEKALELHDGNQTRAARALGITRNTIIYRMRKHGIGQTS